MTTGPRLLNCCAALCGAECRRASTQFSSSVAQIGKFPRVDCVDSRRINVKLLFGFGFGCMGAERLERADSRREPAGSVLLASLSARCSSVHVCSWVVAQAIVARPAPRPAPPPAEQLESVLRNGEPKSAPNAHGHRLARTVSHISSYLGNVSALSLRLSRPCLYSISNDLQWQRVLCIYVFQFSSSALHTICLVVKRARMEGDGRYGHVRVPRPEHMQRNIVYNVYEAAKW